MSPSTKQRNLAARMGRWSAHHWKTATFGWLALVVVAFGIGGMVGTKAPDPSTSGPGQSGRMDRILDAGFKQPAAESVLIQSSSAPAGDPAFSAAIEDVVASINPIPDDQPDTPARWGVTFGVDDADATAAKAAELGGTVVVMPFDAPWVRMAVVADPQGATFIASQFVLENKDLGV